MSSMLQHSQLTGEADVVWLEDTVNLDYVRQALDKVNTRRPAPLRPRRPSGRLHRARPGRRARP
jgi:hypothetical protein